MYSLIVILSLCGAALASPNACFGRPNSSFVQDVTACNGFLLCLGGNPIPGRCNHPWLFNPITQVCDHATNVNCFRCPQNIPFIDIALPNACNQFGRCINGVATRQFCPDGMLFDATIAQCNIATATRCIISTQCPLVDNPQNPIFHANGTDCSRFTVCSGGVATSRQCRNGMHFNTARRSCDLPANANCISSGGNTPEVFRCPSTGGPLHAHPTNCSQYFACANNNATLLSCAENFFFDPIRQTCDFAANVPCANAPFRCPATGGPLHPHPTNCSQFYVCSPNNPPTLLDCAPGFYFDPTAGICAPANTVLNCGENAFVCPPTGGPLHAHPRNCNKYFVCSNGLATMLSCAENFSFDPVRQLCDRTQNVPSCNNRSMSIV